MRVLILGGTGSIGGAVLAALVKEQHDVFALSRSTKAASKIRKAGATPIPGDIRNPKEWLSYIKDVDAVVHAACTWTDDMDSVDQALVATLLDALHTPEASKALIYTGGCWFYGNTGDVVATELTPMSPGAGFTSAMDAIHKVLVNSNVRGMVIHPAMVYEHRGGVFQGMYEDIKKHGHVRVFGGFDVRWPLIHRDDLAQVYALMLDKGEAGDVFNASAIDGVAVGAIARAISAIAGNGCDPIIYNVEQAKAEFGDWAEGYALDQQMSGQKARTELSWRPEHIDVFDDI